MRLFSSLSGILDFVSRPLLLLLIGGPMKTLKLCQKCTNERTHLAFLDEKVFNGACSLCEASGPIVYVGKEQFTKYLKSHIIAYRLKKKLDKSRRVC